MGVSTGIGDGYGGVWFIWRSKYVKMCCSAAGRQVAAGAVSDVHVSRDRAYFDSGGVFYAPWFVLVSPKWGCNTPQGAWWRSVVRNLASGRGPCLGLIVFNL